MGKGFQETGWEMQVPVCFLGQDWDAHPAHFPHPREEEAGWAVTCTAVPLGQKVGPASTRTASCRESLRDGAHQGLCQPCWPLF